MTTYWDDGVGAPGYLKGGAFGEQGTGKSVTATLLAIVTRKHFDLKGPIAMFDTEGGSAYLKDIVRDLTGEPLLVRRARAFEELLTWGKQCMADGISVGIVDSITHPWREVCQAYLAQKNEARRKLAEERGWKFREQTGLEFEDWNVLKPRWAIWTDFYLNSPTHLIVNGREGGIFNMEADEETGKKKLEKAGVRMKTETEFGYEPSLLFRMSLDRRLVKGKPDNVRKALVLKDRFMNLDGQEGVFPNTKDIKAAMGAVQKFFAPHLERLKPGNHAPVDTTLKTQFNVDDSTGETEWQKERRNRQILSEEIQGELVAAYPGQGAQDKATKAELLFHVFNTRSWTQVENLPSVKLREGLKKMREQIAKMKGLPSPTPSMASPASEPGAEEGAAALSDTTACPACSTPLKTKGEQTFCPECGWNPKHAAPPPDAEKKPRARKAAAETKPTPPPMPDASPDPTCKHPSIPPGHPKPGKTLVCLDCTQEVKGPPVQKTEEPPDDLVLEEPRESVASVQTSAE